MSRFAYYTLEQIIVYGFGDATHGEQEYAWSLDALSVSCLDDKDYAEPNKLYAIYVPPGSVIQ